MKHHLGRAVTDAVVATLEAAGLTVGRGEAPDQAGWQGTPAASTFKPYVVVHPLAGGQLDGAIDWGFEDAEIRYQINAVGATQQQAEWAADTARAALLDNDLAVAGRAVHRADVELGGARRDDQTQPPIWWIADRITLTTTPA